VRLALTVDIIQGAWHWRPLKVWLRGVRIPQCLGLRVTAYKVIDGGKYRFYVGLALPVLGTVITYSGCLEADASSFAN
jgi:hypothetical protein